MSDLATQLIHHPYRPPEGFEAVAPGVHKASTVIFPNVQALRTQEWKDKSGYTYGLQGAVRAPWGMDPALREAIAKLRSAGNTVVCVLPGHEHEIDEFQCDRELVQVPSEGGVWVLKNL